MSNPLSNIRKRIFAGDPNEMLDRGRGSTVFLWIAAGLGLSIPVFYFIFGIFAFGFVFRPAALYYAFFWTAAFVEAGVMFASASAAGYGKIIGRVILWDIIGLFLSLLSFISCGAFFGVSLVFNWECTLSVGSLNALESLICDDHKWVLITLWWANFYVGTIGAVTAIAHLASMITAQAPKIGNVLPMNWGAQMPSGGRQIAGEQPMTFMPTPVSPGTKVASYVPSKDQ